jgi:ABC-type amino acid transport substrate-binding protein
MKFGAITSLVCLLCFFSATSAVSQSQLPPEIKVGIRTSVPPIGSYRIQAGSEKYEGFCSLFGRELEDSLSLRFPSLKIKVSYQVIINEYKEPPFNRYAGLKMGKVHIECGPNSSSSSFKDILFSQSFYETGIKLLLKKDLANQITDLKRNINSLAVGVIRDTTTLKYLSNSGNNVRSLKVYDTRDKALEDLNNGVIEAYASDAIILRAILEEGKSKDYVVFPKKTYLTNKKEQYAMAIYGGTQYFNELIDIIDQVLEKPKLKDAQQKLKQYEDGLYPDWILIFFLGAVFSIVVISVIILLLSAKSRAEFVNGLAQGINPLFHQIPAVVVEIIRRITGLR